MPDLSTTLADGDAGHTLGHKDERTEINSLRSRTASLESTVSGHTTSIASKYTLPAGGAGLDILSATALNGLVQTDGTVLRAVKLTQAEYDALATKVATTLYVISG